MASTLAAGDLGAEGVEALVDESIGRYALCSASERGQCESHRVTFCHHPTRLDPPEELFLAKLAPEPLGRVVHHGRVGTEGRESGAGRLGGTTALNLLREGISTIIWATGYGLDYGWIDAPLLDELGYPRNTRGVAAVPGLYFLGLLWQHSQASASLVGPGLDGPHLLEVMNRQARHRSGPATVTAVRPRRGRPREQR